MQAISLAIQHPDLIAVTTVHGCVSVEQATANVARLQRANAVQPIPIYQGLSEALIRKPFVVHPFFGIDGIGDRPDLFPEASSADFAAQEAEPAVLALSRLVKEHEDVTLVCIGPLTNVAIAYKLDPKFAKRLKKLVILGGNYLGVGNMDEMSSAEFNFGSDPEAAKIVIEEMNTPITMVPWEVHYLRDVKHEECVDFDAHLRYETPLASFLALASQIGLVMTNYNRQYNYCDEIAVAVAINEGLIASKTMNLRIGIELAGQVTRGQVVVDWTGVLYDVDRSRPTIRVVVDYDVKALDRWMQNTVLRKEAPW
ncbi:unnamed protein product [Heligmosomoides polygyrus]|uniref:IU_nuc_hydro domain-containing protein n=1 Tax=Heligmosomoides polygyrus TaxID=6339 RepID=A0A3P7XZ37_HELPZ|nr:unnamed protein product [Heligmosomoides polygyrus]